MTLFNAVNDTNPMLVRRIFHWKLNTALCLLTVVVLYSLTGLLFGLIVGYCFGMEGRLIPIAVGIMFSVSLVVVAICYFKVPNTPYGCDEWVEITDDVGPGFNAMLDCLCEFVRIPRPRIYITSDSFPNAYALGKTPETAHVCITSGLIDLLMEDRITRKEFNAIISHELAHIANRDTILMSVAGNCMKALSISVIIFEHFSRILAEKTISNGDKKYSPYFTMVMVLVSLASLIFAMISIVTIPGAAIITHCAISRNREYLADQVGATTCGMPWELASALRKLHDYSASYQVVSAYDVSRWTINPNGIGNHGIFSYLYDTHPPIEKRIRVLNVMTEMIKNKKK